MLGGRLYAFLLQLGVPAENLKLHWHVRQKMTEFGAISNFNSNCKISFKHGHLRFQFRVMLHCNLLGPFDKVEKWQIGKMTNWQNDYLAKWLFGKMAYWQNDILAKWRIGKMTNLQNDKFAKWQICKITIVKCYITNAKNINWKIEITQWQLTQSKLQNAKWPSV